MSQLLFPKPANRAQVAAWSGMSRNRVEAFMARFGVVSVRGCFPWDRVWREVLGLEPETQKDVDYLATGLMRLGEAATRFSVSAETLLSEARTGKFNLPPLYAFGPRQHFFLRCQVEEMLGSPKNLYPLFQRVEDRALPRSDLAARLKVEPWRIQELIADADDRPAHIIVAGKARYFVADVSRRLAATVSSDADTPIPSAVVDAPAEGGGFLAQAVATGGNTTVDRTRSLPDAPEGDVSQRSQPEAIRPRS